jgi:hypothetical protein
MRNVEDRIGHSSAVWVSPLAEHVSKILGLRTKNKVRWIHARSNVTGVHYHQTFRDRPMHLCIHGAVSKDPPPSDGYATVSRLTLDRLHVPRPDPAACVVHLVSSKAFLNRRPRPLGAACLVESVEVCAAVATPGMGSIAPADGASPRHVLVTDGDIGLRGAVDSPARIVGYAESSGLDGLVAVGHGARRFHAVKCTKGGRW